MRAGPTVQARPDLPTRVEIYEVGPRDGLQNEPAVLSADVKASFIAALVDTGLATVEATSFVSPRWVPQMGDATEVCDRLPAADGVRFPVLVPNERGLERALGAGMTDVAVFASATETFAQKNLGRGMDEALAMFAPVIAGVNAAGGRARGYLSMCFAGMAATLGRPSPSRVVRALSTTEGGS